MAVTRGLTGLRRVCPRSRRQGGGSLGPRVACVAGVCQCQREPQRTMYAGPGDRRGRQGRRRGAARGAMGLLDRKPGSVPERNLKLDPAAAGSD